jgi:hypothetical protein
MEHLKAHLWTTFLEECQLMIETETNHPYEWVNIYPTQKQKEDILDELFLKRASIGAIILRNRTNNENKM